MLNDCCVAHLCTCVLQVESEGHTLIPACPSIPRSLWGQSNGPTEQGGALIPEAFSSARVGQGSAGNQNPCLLLHTALYSVRTCMDVQDSQSGGERSRGGDRMKKKWLGRY